MKEFMAGVLASLFSLFGSYGAVVQTAPVINSAAAASSFETPTPAPGPMASTAHPEPAPAFDAAVVSSAPSQERALLPRSTDLSAYVTRAELDAALDQRLAPLSALVPALQQLISRWPTTAAAPTSVFVPSYSISGPSAPLTTTNWALSQRIDNLSGTNISNPVITGGSISEASLSSPSVTGALSITDGTSSIGSLGTERVTNGNFSSDPSASWTLGSGWTWDSGNNRVQFTGTGGGISDLYIESRGWGYSVGDVVTISGGGGDATYTVSAVASASSGRVTGLTQITAGSGYSSATGVATTGGAGTGLVVSIARIADAATTLTHTIITDSSDPTTDYTIPRIEGDETYIGVPYRAAFTIQNYSGNGSVKLALGYVTSDGNKPHWTRSYIRSNGTYTFTFIATSSALTFTPTADFVGAITNVSLKPISPLQSVVRINNDDGTPALEIRPGGSSQYNTFIGLRAGANYTTKSIADEGFNTAVGYQSMYSNTGGDHNTAFGIETLFNNSVGNRNVALGSYALYKNTKASDNTAVGFYPLFNNTTGGWNVAIGTYALNGNTTGNNNIAIGYQAIGNGRMKGDSNIGIGYTTLYSNTTGARNTALGQNAMYDNMTGSDNLALGYSALQSTTIGSANIALGASALVNNLAGSSNIAIGPSALRYASSTSNNVAVGYWAGSGKSTNAFFRGLTTVGYQTGFNLSNGSDYNILLGYQAGFGITTGSNNIWIGTATSSTGIANLTTGSQNILIGNNISLASSTASGQLNIGNILYGTGITSTGSTLSSGSLGVGTTSPWRKFSVTGPVGFDGLTGATGAGSLCLTANREVVFNSGSDACLPSLRATKHDIARLDFDALALVSRLEPVSFVYNDGDGRTRWGFIAEDAAAVDPHLATYDASSTISGIDDRSMIALIVRAVQKLVADMAGLADRVATQELTYKRASGDELTTKELKTGKLCVDDVCVTRDQFLRIVEQSGQSPAPSPTPADPPADPTPEEVADQDEAADDAPSIVPEEDPLSAEQESAPLP